MQYLKYRKFILCSEVVFLVLFFTAISFAQSNFLLTDEVVIRPFYGKKKMDVFYPFCKNVNSFFCIVTSSPQMTYKYEGKKSGLFYVHSEGIPFGCSPFFYYVFYTDIKDAYYHNIGEKWNMFIEQKEKRKLYKKRKISIKNRNIHFTFYLPSRIFPEKINLACFDSRQKIFSHTIDVRYCSFLSVIDNLRQKNSLMYGIILVFLIILIGLLYNLILSMFKI